MSKKMLSFSEKQSDTVEPPFKGHPRDQGKCSLNRVPNLVPRALFPGFGGGATNQNDGLAGRRHGPFPPHLQSQEKSALTGGRGCIVP